MNPNDAYSYCNYQGWVRNPENYEWKKNFHHKARTFDPAVLRQKNFISTMSLIRTECFPGFDEDLERLQDWDLWLTIWDIHKKGGAWIDDTLFMAYYLDKGISANDNWNQARRAIAKKHKI